MYMYNVTVSLLTDNIVHEIPNSFSGILCSDIMLLTLWFTDLRRFKKRKRFSERRLREKRSWKGSSLVRSSTVFCVHGQCTRCIYIMTTVSNRQVCTCNPLLWSRVWACTTMLLRLWASYMYMYRYALES